jgi:PAS domain S-box-containing protein
MREEHLELFFRLSLDMLCVCSSDGYFVRVNPAFTRVLGYTEAELLARPYIDLVHPDDQPETETMTSGIASGRAVDYYENRYRCKDGSWRWIAWTASAAEVVDGLFYAVARDVTEQKAQAEAREELVIRLLASLEKIRTLEGLLPVCSWCHRIRDEEGGWDRVEHYIRKHARAEITHGICPDCEAKNFPE